MLGRPSGSRFLISTSSGIRSGARVGTPIWRMLPAQSIIEETGTTFPSAVTAASCWLFVTRSAMTCCATSDSIDARSIGMSESFTFPKLARMILGTSQLLIGQTTTSSSGCE